MMRYKNDTHGNDVAIDVNTGPRHGSGSDSDSGLDLANEVFQYEEDNNRYGNKYEENDGNNHHDFCIEDSSSDSHSGGITTISNFFVDGQSQGNQGHYRRSTFEVVDVYDAPPSFPAASGGGCSSSNGDSNLDSFESYYRMQKNGPMISGTDIPQSRLSMYQDSVENNSSRPPISNDEWDSDRGGGSSLSSITNDFFSGRSASAAKAAIGGWTKRHFLGNAPSPSKNNNHHRVVMNGGSTSVFTGSPASRSRKTLGVGNSNSNWSPRRKRLHWFSSRTVDETPPPNGSSSTSPDQLTNTPPPPPPPESSSPPQSSSPYPSSSSPVSPPHSPQHHSTSLEHNRTISPPGEVVVSPPPPHPPTNHQFHFQVQLFQYPTSAPSICSSLGSQFFTNELRERYSANILRSYKGGVDQFKSLPRKRKLGVLFAFLVLAMGIISVIAVVVANNGNDHNDASDAEGETQIKNNHDYEGDVLLDRGDTLPQSCCVDNNYNGLEPIHVPSDLLPVEDSHETDGRPVVVATLPNVVTTVTAPQNQQQNNSGGMDQSTIIPSLEKDPVIFGQSEVQHAPQTLDDNGNDAGKNSNAAGGSDDPTTKEYEVSTSSLATTPTTLPTYTGLPPSHQPIVASKRTPSPATTTTTTTPKPIISKPAIPAGYPTKNPTKSPTTSPTTTTTTAPTPPPTTAQAGPTTQSPPTTSTTTTKPSKNPTPKPSKGTNNGSGNGNGNNNGDGSGNGNGDGNGGGNADPPVTPKASRLQLKPDTDTYINESRPSRNYDNDPDLRIKGGSLTEVYLRFEISSILHNGIAEATLWLYLLPDVDDDGSTSNIRGLSDIKVDMIIGASDESEITWENNPFNSYESINVASFSVEEGAIQANDSPKLYKVNVKSAIQQYISDADGLFDAPITVAFKLYSESSSGSVRFASRNYDDGSASPELIVVWSEDGNAASTTLPSINSSTAPSTSHTTTSPVSSEPSTAGPTNTPESSPSSAPTRTPTTSPVNSPSTEPTHTPVTYHPTTSSPTNPVTYQPATRVTTNPTTEAPAGKPTYVPSFSLRPSAFPSQELSNVPSIAPTTMSPTESPSSTPTTSKPTTHPTINPTSGPSASPVQSPSTSPVTPPPTTARPTTASPSNGPTGSPVATTNTPTTSPSSAPRQSPTTTPTHKPTNAVTATATVCSQRRWYYNGDLNICSNRESNNLWPPFDTIEDCCDERFGGIQNCPADDICRPTSAPTTIKPTSKAPTTSPLNAPTTVKPTTHSPTSKAPTTHPTTKPTTKAPTTHPTTKPTTKAPTTHPTTKPTTKAPTTHPTTKPSKAPSQEPSKAPTKRPSKNPTRQPSREPSKELTPDPTKATPKPLDVESTPKPTDEEDDGETI